MPLDVLGCTRTTIVVVICVKNVKTIERDCILKSIHEHGIASNREFIKARRMCPCSLYTPPVVIEDGAMYE